MGRNKGYSPPMISKESPIWGLMKPIIVPEIILPNKAGHFLGLFPPCLSPKDGVGCGTPFQMIYLYKWLKNHGGLIRSPLTSPWVILK